MAIGTPTTLNQSKQSPVVGIRVLVMMVQRTNANPIEVMAMHVVAVRCLQYVVKRIWVTINTKRILLGIHVRVQMVPLMNANPIKETDPRVAPVLCPPYVAKRM